MHLVHLIKYFIKHLIWNALKLDLKSIPLVLVFLGLSLSNVLSPRIGYQLSRGSPMVGMLPQASEPASWSHFSLDSPLRPYYMLG
jgi:hypothetical protein